jgi:16S rRNA (guanine527-N7)-methyltransferase
MPDFPDPSAVQRQHQQLLERWRGAMNLVGPGSTDIHFEDSAFVAKAIEPRGRWADLGSGAGFPGVAVAAFNPGVRITLVESRAKRVAFLRRVLQQTGLPNAEVFHGRVESLEQAAWDGLISRAFAPPDAVLEHARGLLRPGGVLALMLTREATEPPPDFELQQQRCYRAGGKDRVLTALQSIG